jgi:hypothetical protein
VADRRDPFPACDVCGRTILKGEQIHEYLAPQRDRIRVCVLCRSRAESSGWIPVSMAHTLEEEQPRRSRRLALRQRFGRAAARAREAASPRREPEPAPEQAPPREAQPAQEASPPQAMPWPQPVAEATQGSPPPTRRPRARAPKWPSPRNEGRATAAPRRSRAKRGPEALMRRAVERFNSSEERRKVAGLMRSLGEPQAGVRPDPRRQLALVTVAWELSWYQWEVSADGDGEERVREVAKGAEVSELDAAAKAWNAVVDEDGTLRLRSAAERQRQGAAREA